MKEINVVFIGGLTNGKIVYDYLKSNKYVQLDLAITYIDNLLLPRFTFFEDVDNLVKDNSIKKYIEKIKEINPDYIFVCGWSELIPEEVLHSVKKFVIGFHPSKLPYNRGRSVLAWQIEDGLNETALTMFVYNNFPDGGGIIAQENIKVNENDYINDVLNKIDCATYNLMKSYFPLIRQGKINPKPQDLSVGNFRRLRNNKDSLINWQSNSIDIFNKIRAISFPYPGADAFINNKKIKIWESIVINDFEYGNECNAGLLIATLYDNSLIVKTKDSFIRISKWEEIKK